MELNKAPLFKVEVQTSGYGNNKMLVSSNKDSSNDNLSVDESFQELERFLKVYTNNFQNPGRFFITLFKNSKANNGGMYGPYLYENVPETTTEQQQGNPLQGVPFQSPFDIDVLKQQYLGGLDLQSKMLEPRMEIEREKSQIMLEKVLLERDKKEFEEHKKRELEKLSGLEVEYTSKTNMAKKGAEKALWSFIDKLIGGDEEIPSLAGTPEDTIELTNEQKLIQSIAEHINNAYENGKLSYEEIELVGTVVAKTIKRINSHETNVHKTELEPAEQTA